MRLTSIQRALFFIFGLPAFMLVVFAAAAAANASFGTPSIFALSASGSSITAEDADGDSVPDISDNCPAWPNEDQRLPPWFVPPGDSDCDGFPDTVITSGREPETALGTDPDWHCAATQQPNDEPPPDNWPADFNDDQQLTGSDWLKFAGVYNRIWPAAGYDLRFDLNGDRKVNGQDLLMLSSFFRKRCAPLPPPTPSPTPSPTPTPHPTVGPTFPPSQCDALPVTTPAGAPPGGPPVTNGYTVSLLPADAAVNKLTNVVLVPADPGRAVITSESGGIYLICLSGNAPRQQMADLSDVVRDYDGASDSDEGLVGFAFDPIDPSLVYVDYSMGRDYLGPSPPLADTVRSRISRFHLVNGQLDRGSEKVILDIYQPGTNHNGDGLVFGPDGMLYIGSGDGGAYAAMGQTLDDFWGAILRIDVHSGDPYAIPSGNPFADGPGGNADEVWAYGFRNPWRFSFDGNQMWVGDVGERGLEEVNIVDAGLNYGWNTMEGYGCLQPIDGTPTPGPTCNPSGLATPRAGYTHDFFTGGCAIAGGHVYHGASMPELDSYYIYGDWCTGHIWALDTTNGTSAPIMLGDTNLRIVSWGVTAQGEIVAVNYTSPNLGGGVSAGIYQLTRLS